MRLSLNLKLQLIGQVGASLHIKCRQHQPLSGSMSDCGRKKEHQVCCKRRQPGAVQNEAFHLCEKKRATLPERVASTFRRM